MRFFPPVVTGPIIIAIGLILAPSAINNCSSNWLIALVAIVVIVICNIWGKGMIKIIPILMGVIVSYAVAGIFGKVDFSGVKEAAWIGLPFQMKNTVFGLFAGGNVNTGLLVSSIIMVVPIAFATMMEHVGDVSAISSTIERNLIEDPGLHRTLIGDGLGTTIAALFGAPANTTYGENTGVLVLTKVYDPLVVRLAAVFAVVLSFCPKFAALISAMPSATIGGVSIVLYGMISAVGVSNMVENHTDFQKSRNVIVAAVILGLALGINFSGLLGADITTAGNNATGAIAFTIGNMRVALSGLAVASIVGIILNAILPDKREEYMPNDENSGSLGRF
jgi:uracil permease